MVNIADIKTAELISPPADEPLTLAEVKQNVKLDDGFTSDDSELILMIKKAREACELQTGLRLISQQWKARLDAFATVIRLWGLTPIISIDSVKYYDVDNVLQTVATADYDTDIYSQPAIIKTIAGWPATYSKMNAVEISVTVGYGEPKDVPEMVRDWMKLLINHHYDNRTPVIVGGAPLEVPKSLDWIRNQIRVWGLA